MSTHRYPRTARLNELLHQIVAEEIERLDDERLDLVTVMSVEVEPDLRHATVYVDTPTGADRDEEMLAALGDHRVALQKAIGQQARIKRTPQLAFRVDEVERSAGRIEDVIRHLHPDDQ
ncbi:MAG TPA: 30S ribosome-binding factor RbfA [Acidimicrobiales bacterium]|nr:30S ribosome-binding factor RbfA [Acidimicrobiales bacterium]